MVGRSAQAHVEIILSTVLFVGFLIFVFIFLSYSFKSNPEISTVKIENKILESISLELGKLAVVVHSVDDCYSLDDVNDDYGANFVEIQDVDNPRSYTIYYGNFFDPDLGGRISCEGKPINFDFGVYSKEEIIVSQEIKNFKTSYDNGYETLKDSLGIGDFSFRFKNLDGTIIPLLSIIEKIPENVDVVSIDFPVRVVDDKAEFQELILNIRVWR